MINDVFFVILLLSFFSAVLYTLAKQAKELNYKKLNLQVNNRIQTLRVPPNLQEQVDVCSISILCDFVAVVIVDEIRLMVFYLIFVFLFADQLHCK